MSKLPQGFQSEILPSTQPTPGKATLIHAIMENALSRSLPRAVLGDEPSDPKRLEQCRKIYEKQPVVPNIPVVESSKENDFKIDHWVGKEIDPTLRPKANPEILAACRTIYETQAMEIGSKYRKDFIQGQEEKDNYPINHWYGKEIDPALRPKANPQVLAACRNIYETQAMQKTLPNVEKLIEEKSKQTTQDQTPKQPLRRLRYIQQDDLLEKIELAMRQLISSAHVIACSRLPELYLIFMRIGTLFDSGIELETFELKSINMVLERLFIQIETTKFEEITNADVEILDAVVRQFVRQLERN